MHQYYLSAPRVFVRTNIQQDSLFPFSLHTHHMDLLSILPTFSTKSYSHILPPLERNHINTVDLITLDTLEIAKRAHVPPADVRRLSAHILDALHGDVGFERDIGGIEDAGNTQGSSFNADVPVVPGPLTRVDLSRWSVISTLDPAMDALLDGGIPTGYVTEVTGERLFPFPLTNTKKVQWKLTNQNPSGSGKTQFLLSLLLAVQLPSPKGLAKRAIYISTEAPLATPRLSQYLQFHPYLSSLPRGQTPSLQNVLSINAMDLESQDHILNYQLPVAIARYNVGLVVIDSITANFRAEHTSHDVNALSTRSGELAKLGQLLRNLAAQENIAIVVANQVSDRFDPMDNSNNPIINSRVYGASNNLTQPTPDSPTPQTRTAPASTEAANIDLSQPSQLHPPINAPPASSPAFPSSPFTTEEDPQFDGSYLVGNPIRNETLSLLHQQRFFTGWGDSPSTSFAVHQKQTPKTPALGFVWTTQIACRIALKKEDKEEDTFPPRVEYEYRDGSSPTVAGSGPQHAQSESGSTQDKQEEGEKAPSSGDQPKSTPNPAPAATESNEKPLKRTMKLVFAPWSSGSSVPNHKPNPSGTDAVPAQDEVEFAIWKGGLRSVAVNGGSGESG